MSSADQTKLCLIINNYWFVRRAEESHSQPKCSEEDFCVQLKLSSTKFQGKSHEVQTEDGPVWYDSLGMTLTLDSFFALLESTEFSTFWTTANELNQETLERKKKAGSIVQFLSPTKKPKRDHLAKYLQQTKENEDVDVDVDVADHDVVEVESGYNKDGRGNSISGKSATTTATANISAPGTKMMYSKK